MYPTSRSVLGILASAGILLASANLAVAQTLVQSLADFGGDNNNNGQSFLPSDSGASGTAYLTLFRFYKSDFPGADSAGTRSLTIATGFSSGNLTGVVGTSINTVDWNTTADLDTLPFFFNSLPLSATTTYVAIFTVGGTPTGAGIRFQSTDPYANGTLFHLGDAYAPADAKFIADFAAIPEPSSYAVAVGALMLGWTLQSKRRRVTLEPS